MCSEESLDGSRRKHFLLFWGVLAERHKFKYDCFILLLEEIRSHLSLERESEPIRNTVLKPSRLAWKFNILMLMFQLLHPDREHVF